MAIARMCDNCKEYFSTLMEDTKGYNCIYLQHIQDSKRDCEVATTTEHRLDLCPKCAEAIHMALLNRVKEAEKNGTNVSM